MHSWAAQIFAPKRKPTAILTESSSSFRPSDGSGTAFSHAPEVSSALAKRRALSLGLCALVSRLAAVHWQHGESQSFCILLHELSGGIASGPTLVFHTVRAASVAGSTVSRRCCGRREDVIFSAPAAEARKADGARETLSLSRYHALSARWRS